MRTRLLLLGVLFAATVGSIACGAPSPTFDLGTGDPGTPSAVSADEADLAAVPVADEVVEIDPDEPDYRSDEGL